MVIAEKVRALILSRYKSIRSFCIMHDLKYTTVISVLDRGIENAAFSTVTDIAHALGFDADDFTSIEKFELALSHNSKYDFLDQLKSDPQVRLVARISGDLTEEGKKDLLKYAELLRNQKNRSGDD